MIQNRGLNKKTTKFSFEKITQFSERDHSYANPNSPLRQLLPYSPDLEGLKKSCSHRKSLSTNRALLVDVVIEQYRGFEQKAEVEKNIQLLGNENCYTITTAHQPIVFTGPLYVIYKALSAIQWAQKAEKSLGNCHVVPVFVIGGEDHDFEEIKSTKIFRKNIDWEYDHPGGPVGLIPSKEMNPLVTQVEGLFENDPKGMSLLKAMHAAYEKNSSFSRATREILHHLMGHLGLICLDMSHPTLKREFIPFIKKEILYSVSQPLVQTRQNELKSLGFDEQAYVRKINFFYLQKQSRDLIFRKGDHFELDDGSKSWSEKEMIIEIEEHPERFSPNVVMRPIYQSYILPDLAYVGGGGELAYWMERPLQFEAFNVHFPVLLRRKSMAIMDESLATQWLEMGFVMEDILDYSDQLKKKFIHHESEVDLDDEKKLLVDLFGAVEKKAMEVDPSLQGKVKGMEKSVENMLEGLEKRLVRSLKKKYDERISKIDKIKKRVHPDRSLQERKENVLSFYSRTDGSFIDYLMDKVDTTNGSFDLLVI